MKMPPAVLMRLRQLIVHVAGTVNSAAVGNMPAHTQGFTTHVVCAAACACMHRHTVLTQIGGQHQQYECSNRPVLDEGCFHDRICSNHVRAEGMEQGGCAPQQQVRTQCPCAACAARQQVQHHAFANRSTMHFCCTARGMHSTDLPLRSKLMLTCSAHIL